MLKYYQESFIKFFWRVILIYIIKSCFIRNDCVKKNRDRIFVLYLSVCFIFVLLILRLFFMQVINGDKYLANLSLNIIKKINIHAPRGIIYDRYGRTIAQNKFAYNIKLDPSIKINNLNESLYNLIKLLEKNQENYLDDLPISKFEPFEFIFDSDNEKERWLKDMNINKNFDASQVFEYLINLFDISSELDNLEARKIIALRVKLYMQRYRQYEPLTIAINIKNQTIVAIEEDNKKYSGIYIDSEPMRDYINSECFANLIGYLGNITEQELLENKNYKPSDIIGKTGLEKSFEKNLRGTDGELLIQVNNMGRRVGVINKTDAIPGDNLFLTIDKDLQEKTYKILENILSQVLKAKLSHGNINLNNLFVSMLDTNALSIKNIFESQEIYSSKIKNFVLQKDLKANYLNSEGQNNIRKIIADGIKTQEINLKEILFVMHEQEIITGSLDYLNKNTASKIFYDKLDSGEILPKLFNFDPCSGSVIILDTQTGEVLASVSYPSYDNNKLNLSSEYYKQILTAKNTPMVNRPFMEPRAPGSTFKMLTGLAGLQEGVINPDSLIYDESIFKKAGVPYSKCWSHNSHGNLNISSALEVSCNYFFFETAYRLGNAKLNNTLEGIKKLNFYMREFGLDERTGVEIGELYDLLEPGISHISSPEYKKQKNTQEKLIWYDGDTIRTAIGQSKNNYTAANMAKYINTLASGGKRFKLYLTREIKDYQNDLIKKNYPELENTIKLDSKNLDAIYKGMLLVNESTRGTGHAVFANFPIRVAGKTGTAQENNSRPDHTSYGGFAPFENPRIAFYILIPFGDTKLTLSPSSQVARQIITEYFKLNSQEIIYSQENYFTQ